MWSLLEAVAPVQAFRTRQELKQTRRGWWENESVVGEEKDTIVLCPHGSPRKVRSACNSMTTTRSDKGTKVLGLERWLSVGKGAC